MWDILTADKHNVSFECGGTHMYSRAKNTIFMSNDEPIRKITLIMK